MAKTRGLMATFGGGAGVEALSSEEYRARVAAIKGLMGALDALRGDASLTDAMDVIGLAIERMADGLAGALAGSARAFSREIHKDKSYYIDDIWEALGKYAYSTGADSAEAMAPLLKLDWAIEQCHKTIAEAREATIERLKAEVVDASDDLPVGGAMDQFERDAAEVAEKLRP